jgi:AcrR family transcriptional regulator
MPPRPLSRAQHADRQALVLRQTRALAREVGWGGVTMRAVAERSGLSAPSVYEQFAGKDALLAAVATAGFGELATALRAEAGAGLRGCAERYWRFAEDEPQLYELMFHRPLALPFASAATPAELHDGFAALASHVVAAARDLGITLADPDTATEAWWSALHGTVSLLLSGRLRPHAETLLQIATDTFTAGLRAGALDPTNDPQGMPS